LRLLYRVSRGKVAAFFKEVGATQMEMVGGDDSRKTVFVLVFEDNKMLEQRVLKICQSFTNHTYVMPKGFTRQLRYQKIIELQREITNSIGLLQTTRAQVREYLLSIQRIDGNDNDSILVEMDLFTLYRLYLEREK
jgi:hypothetical protein